LNAETLRPWLALAQTPGLGGKKILELIARFGDPAAVLRQSHTDLLAAGLGESTVRALRQPRWQTVDRALAWAERPGCRILPLSDPAYPEALKPIPSPPAVLFVQGDPETLRRPQIAIVGSRNPTETGRRLAFEFAAQLGSLGLVVTSGLALGIDEAAHQGALSRGTTVAVAGTGPDRVYPARHRKLAEEIADRGAIVTEFPPGTPVRPQHFPRRNRIISGLSLGTLVVEATRRSGSLITARHALEQGREVMAVPGSIHNPQAKGCNGLIREGATLVETVEDVLESLGLLPAIDPPADANPRPSLAQNAELGEDYRDLLARIDFSPTPVDRLVEETGLPPEEIASMLFILELEGHISSVAGGCYQRIR